MSGIESILEGTIFQWIGVTSSVNALMEVLINSMSLSNYLHCFHFVNINKIPDLDLLI